MSGNSRSGRKTKSEEQNLVENINKHISKDEAILKLKDMIFKDSNFKALQPVSYTHLTLPTKRIV